MKRLTLLAALGLIIAGVRFAAAQEEEEKSMMEQMQSCEVCKTMMDHPQIMEKMTWETHKIDNGMLCLATVPKEQVKEFRKLNKEMMANVEKVKAKMQRGESCELCTFCSGMGELMQAGAKQQEIETANGGISLITADDPEVVKMIHAAADKAIEEQKKMEQMKQTAAN